MKIKYSIGVLGLVMFMILFVRSTAGAYGVKSIRVEPLEETTRIIIETDEEYSYRDFFINNPPRIVVDFDGADHQLPRWDFGTVQLGGIEKIRTSQYRENTVRVALELTEPKEYSLFRKENSLMVVLSNAGGSFEPWVSASFADTTAADTEPGEDDWQYNGTGGVALHEDPISVDFEEANIKVVLRAFSEFSGQSIVAGRSVTGTVTARVTDVPWTQALETILKANGYGFQYSNGVYIVDKLENLRATEALESLQPTVFRLNYIVASEIVPIIENILSDRGAVSTDEKTNSVVVTDVPSKIEEIAKVLPKLDQETKQVNIKSKLIFVDTSDLTQLGIDWKVGNLTNPRTDVHGEASTDGARLADPFLDMSLGTFHSGVNVSGALQALQEQQIIDVQAQPEITTLDNLPAEVFVGERTPIRVIDVGAQATEAATIQLVESGIRLSVIPHITNNNKIVMDLRAERSQSVPDPSEFGVKWQTQEAHTTLLVDDGQTAVIGGLTTYTTIDSKRGVPGLSSIPVLGNLFKFKSKDKEKVDLLIFVTPYIVDRGVMQTQALSEDSTESAAN